MSLGDVPEDTRIFIDANVFLNVALKQVHAGHCKDFLKKVHERKLRGFVSLVVLDEILFKLLQGEISNKFKVPLREAVGYAKRNPKCLPQLTKSWDAIENILSMNITVLDMPKELNSVISNCKRYGLLTKDSLHVTVMEQNNIKDIATSDADFERVDFLTLWKP